jgi:hypothetical protein
MNSKPVATLVTVATVALAVLTALAATGVLSGKAAAFVAGAILILNAGLGVVAHSKVTPLAAPMSADGRPLVPISAARRTEP